MFLEIHTKISSSSVEGPFRRFVIWVQGCSIRCAYCANQQMWAVGQGSKVEVDTLFSEISAQQGIEGVTFLGGEPFDQAAPVAELAGLVQQIGLGVLTFSGYTYEYLIGQSRADYSALLQHTDLLIDGPFRYEFLTMDLPWVGSENQRYIHLSERYQGFNFHDVTNKLEIRFKQDGGCSINGIEDESILNDILRRIAR